MNGNGDALLSALIALRARMIDEASEIAEDNADAWRAGDKSGEAAMLFGYVAASTFWAEQLQIIIQETQTFIRPVEEE